ncbi:unnamed protein product [Fusarium venenatum]|uniref:Uncharacterized protein n=1 Tax=Fusarium venenatum TaxID=56646 RepID=A0A2L2TJM4_9HYPO|nr:uncharacterized protein FVRRES_04896 [Fusarium venenatum]CEI60460.1 unnamed protein product [Fusarium venenatum]
MASMSGAIGYSVDKTADPDSVLGPWTSFPTASGVVLISKVPTVSTIGKAENSLIQDFGAIMGHLRLGLQGIK